MAMIKCPECGKEISDKASACPYCGCPKEEFSLLSLNQKPRELSENECPEMFECYKCGRPLPVGISKCIYCGYIYKGSKPNTLFARHIHECKCTCVSCGHEFYYTNIDTEKNKHGRWGDLASAMTLLNGSKIEQAIALNHKNQSYQIDFNKCPKCGSRKLEKTFSEYYINENGEYLKDYEPNLSDKISETVDKGIISTGNLIYKFFLALIIIAIFLVLWSFLQVIGVFI